ncbi:hypothetical protein ACS0TY_032367 [Phlomoides rotata]
MGFLGLQIMFISLAILLILASSSSIVKSDCSSLCGNLFFNNANIEITGISLDGQLTILQYIAYDCYDQNHTNISNNNPSIILFPFTINNTANKFTIMGCDSFGSVYGQCLNDRDYYTGCATACDAIEDIDTGSCTTLRYCQTSISVWKVKIDLTSYNNYSYIIGTNKCSYAFVVEEESLPMVVDWIIEHGTCEKAKMNSSAYACKSANSMCYKPDNGDGYRCSCIQGYRGNPYLVDDC